MHSLKYQTNTILSAQSLFINNFIILPNALFLVKCIQEYILAGIPKIEDPNAT